jgi:hypothetical protein
VASPESDLVTLGADAVRRLVDSGAVTLSEVSPLSSVLRMGAAGAPAAEQDLVAFRDAIDVLARPEAYVRLLILTPGQEDEEVIGILVRQGKAASFSLRDDSLHVGRAQSLAAFVDSLAPALTHTGPLAGGEAWLWPSVIQILTGLWQEQPDPARPLARAAVIEKLTTPEFPAREAESFVQGVVASGAVRVEGDQLVVEPGLRPWLALLWSGHAVQIEYHALAADVPLETAIEVPGPHLLFMGPAGQRVRDEVVSGAALQEHLGGRAPREKTMLHLSAPPPAEVAAALRLLLRVEG